MELVAIDGLVERARQGDAAALNGLFTQLHGTLRSIAGALMKSERGDHTLQPTALVNELLIKMARRLPRIDEPIHSFIGLAVVEMRCILIDHARSRKQRALRSSTRIDPDGLYSSEPSPESASGSRGR